METISIITPWHNSPSLIHTYEQSVKGAEVIIIDNGSRPIVGHELFKMTDRLNGITIFNQENELYAHANNQGLKYASSDIVMFLNNDIKAPSGWLDQVEQDVKPGVICGPSLMPRIIDDWPCPYLEGWCIAGYKSDWDRVGGWDEVNYKGLYWEDNDLCFRLQQAGMRLKECDWPITHFGNFTSGQTPGAYDHSARNRAVFERMVRETLQSGIR